MLLLITLFSVVLCLFLYSLRTDKGKHTKYARADYRPAPKSKPSTSVLKSTSDNSSPYAA
ncbi:hypothetical protein ISS312_01139 [Alteromonas mediterranea]|nr:hypothetical protein ISS312_01139 [Alteromonas mediterranea]